MKVKILFFVSLALLFMFCREITFAAAQNTMVYIDPPFHEAQQVGQTFSINVSISNVENLYGYDFILWYNTTLLDCINVEWPRGHLLTPTLNPSNIWKIKALNETIGAVRVVATLLGDEPSKNGSGILVTITFHTNAIGGPSLLRLHWPGYDYPVKLSDKDANPISCQATDGEVTVIPELSLLSVTLLAMITTLTIIILRKKRILEQTKISS
ncbi:MAG: cohesin domain-containing protein [Candidatus Bathyarchaeia archaeon]